MRGIVIFSVLFFGVFGSATYFFVKRRIFKTVVLGFLGIFLFIMTLFQVANTEKKSLMIVGCGHYYEIVAIMPFPHNGKTLVYAVDLNENKEKVDILNAYPLKGYGIEQVGERTFLLPESTRVAYTKGGETVFIPYNGKAFNVPPDFVFKK
ncbi:MAG: hypothetical protein A2V96_02930 [Candidatus Yonathbacteria bacterium RBG_16_43_6]|uniref:Uncharacterized protein n=1 Tax=Candidatus Yonathbacteria bacterium RIFCSPLOWO2_01_FULL_43_27 TaxID=1802726 RepID=A0A1G2SEX3_9BACT|nr:MAG: hypothetical protein UX62_C0038G0003 [Microgenomates group bacterium GW2011_GWA2_46_7]OHA78712.1 MAG: hypothetical protein A2658_01085 [Candidatus Yonathbacteria bacterium RIFCSPHIGHO2_01_FULL_44_19]OHA80029.1 MAG: hypothetical protein A2V96_02930 [Candidatus Yonathbacteria bacterium RBG_16_43_6]OHA83189.1 MAG: hypothetical protein A3B07_00255 [Candidatus Yonathbacteria bacterium RIFCSPLOWO2_01_FULL_43_27]